MVKPITKAVIAAAGFGTRFLPQTKAMPKEMMPLVDKPIIQYVVEELVSVGITDIVIVTNQNKRSIEDHFDRPNEDLVANLKAAGKLQLLDMIEDISNMANFVYVRQKGPYGNGTPLINCEHLIGDEPFIYTFSDDFIRADPPRFQQMIDVFNQYQSPVLSLIKVNSDQAYAKYGFVSGSEAEPGVIKIESIIEKPGKDKAPSQMASVSGFILTPEIFHYLNQARQMLSSNQELYCNDALKLMLKDAKLLTGCLIKDGKFFDAGNKLDYLKANIEFGLASRDIKEELREFLKDCL